MKKNEVRVIIKTRRGVLPYALLDMKIPKHHLHKLLAYVLEAKAVEDAKE